MVVPSGGLHQEIEDCIQEMIRLKVAELKSVARSIGLTLSGRKADLQDRLRTYLRNSCRVGCIDPWRPKAVHILIGKAQQSEPMPTYESIWQSLKTGAYRHPVATGHQPPSILINNPLASKPAQSPSQSRATLQFGESPFYRLRRMVNGSPRIAMKNTGRGVCTYKFILNQSEIEVLQRGPQFRLFLFSGVLNPLEPQGEAPIQFPHPNEIRFNDVQIKDNVRGLKNKLGTAKPANLTPYLKQAGGENHLQLIYAFTKDDYLIYCYIVEIITPEKLVEKVLKHPKIVIPATLQYLKETLNEDEDDDLVTTSTVMTLQCPISYCRMKYPAKSVHCRHLQCFDALWFIQAQQQIPTWQCPVCQKKIKIQDLALCEFVDDIIKACDDDVEQVEISSDGSWVPKHEDETPAPVPQPAKSQVKKENSEDIHSGEKFVTEDSDDEVVGPRRRAQQAEPMIISLDSDEEADDMSEQRITPLTSAFTAASTLAQSSRGPRLPPVSQVGIPHDQDSLSSIFNAYMDAHPEAPHRTLDPKSIEGTPTGGPADSPSDNSGHDSAAFIQRHHQIPNVLGKTPLNNNERSQGGFKALPSPGNGSPSTGMFGEMNIPLLYTPNNGSNSAQLGDRSSAHVVHSLDPFNSGSVVTSQHNRLPPLNETFSNQPRASESLLGIGGNTSVLSIQPREASNGTSVGTSSNDVTNNMTNGNQSRTDSTSSEELFLAAQSGNNLYQAPISNVSNSTENVGPVSPSDTRAPQQFHNVPPVLPPIAVDSNQRPPLPPVPNAINGKANVMLPFPSGIPPNLPPSVALNSRNKKPLVSPFIPRKPYMNMLPLKRHISSGTANKNASQISQGIDSNNNASSSQEISTNVAGSPPVLASSKANEQDFIDLTSDD